MSDKKNEFRISPEGKVEIVLHLIDGEDEQMVARALGALDIFKDNIKAWVGQMVQAQRMHEKKFGLLKPNGNGTH